MVIRYIPAKDIPVRYGGLKREKDDEFSVENGDISQLLLKGSSTETIEIAAPEVQLPFTL